MSASAEGPRREAQGRCERRACTRTRTRHACARAVGVTLLVLVRCLRARDEGAMKARAPHLRRSAPPTESSALRRAVRRDLQDAGDAGVRIRPSDYGETAWHTYGDEGMAWVECKRPTGGGAMELRFLEMAHLYCLRTFERLEDIAGCPLPVCR